MSLLAKAQTRREQMKVAMVIMTVMLHQQVHHANAFNSVNIRRMMRSSDSDALVVHLLATMREQPSGALDPHNCHLLRIIMRGHEIEFRRMFRLSRNVFEAVFHEISPFLRDGNSRNKKQNIPSRLKLGIALYYMAHGGDAAHLESASGLTKATALKYVHRVAALICSQLAQKWMGESLLKEDGYMEGCRERFRLRNGFPYVGAAIDGAHIPYSPNSGESEQSYKNYKMWTSLLCIGMVNSYHMSATSFSPSGKAGNSMSASTLDKMLFFAIKPLLKISATISHFDTAALIHFSNS